jgi:hypothetical protein
VEPGGSNHRGHARPGTASGSRDPLRLVVALLLTALIVASPWVGAQVAYRYEGEPIDPGFVRTATVMAAVLGAGAWAGLPVVRWAVGARRRALKRSEHEGTTVEDPELVRELLARHDIACVRCGYSLLGLTGSACPECEEPVRLRLGATRPMPFGRLTWMAIGACTLEAMTAGFAMVQFWRFVGLGLAPQQIVWIVWGSVPLLGCLLLCALAVGWIRAEDDRARLLARWRLLTVAVGVLLVSALASAAMILMELLF